MVLFLEFLRGCNRGRIRLNFDLYFFFLMKDLTYIYGLRLLSVALSQLFVLFTVFCIVVMFSVLHGLKIQANFFFFIRPRIGPEVVGLVEPDEVCLGLGKKSV